APPPPGIYTLSLHDALPICLLRAGIALLALLLASEFVLRLAFGLGDPVIYRPDPYCGYLPAANQHVRPFGARNDTNAYGMRSPRSEEHTSELQSRSDLVCRL